MPTDRAAGWRQRYGALAAALALAVLCQAYVIARSPVIAKDGIGFIRIARSLANDPVATLRTEDQHPGYPAMVLTVERSYRWLTGQPEFDCYLVAARLAAAACGLLATVFLWLFARRLYDDRIANITVLLAAVWPLFRLNAGDGLSDSPHLMFYLAGAWLAAEGLVRGRLGWIMAAGAASGLAFWVRPEGLVVGVAAGLAFAMKGLFQNSRWSDLPRSLFRITKQARRPRQVAPLRNMSRGQILFIASVAAATLLVVVPYVLVAGKITSKKLPFHQPVSAHAAAIAAVEPTAGLLAEPPPGGTLPDEFRRPATMLGTLALGLFELARELAQGFYYLALLPLAAGTFAPSRPQPNRGVALLHILLMNGQGALLLLLYLTAGYISHRHVLPLVALMLPTAAAGTVCLADEAARRTRLAGSPRRALAIALCLFYLGLVPKCLKPLHEVYLPILQAAQWVRSQAKPGDSVLSTSGYVRFYADLPGILVGCEAPNLPVGLALAPNKIWSFIVLEVDERSFDRRSLCGAAGQYDQVLELPAHSRKPWAKVLVFRAHSNSSVSLSNNDGPRSASSSSLR